MKSTLLLTWRYLCYNKLKTLIMVVGLTLTLFLPIFSHWLIHSFQSELMSRASQTPLILGAKGNRYDLVLKALYFTAEMPEDITMGDVQVLLDEGRTQAIPLHLKFSASGKALVGTSLDYFEFRSLTLAQGDLPLQLGDVVLGSDVAEQLDLKPGDDLLTDQIDLFDLSATYPLQMKVSGVLKPKGTPDDGAVFVDIKTAWVIDGIGHGHVDLEKTENDELIMERKPGEVVANSAVRQFTRITAENLTDFHFHGNKDEYPVTAVIVAPNDKRSNTILKGRYAGYKNLQLLDPENVIEELMGIVFKVKRFFDASFILICLTVGLFILQIVLLSLKIREREMRTMVRIGCSRSTLLKLQLTELGLILMVSSLLALSLSWILVSKGPNLLGIF